MRKKSVLWLVAWCANAAVSIGVAVNFGDANAGLAAGFGVWGGLSVFIGLIGSIMLDD